MKISHKGSEEAPNELPTLLEEAQSGRATTIMIEKYKADMRRRFRQLARDIGAREPDPLGDSLMLLWEGAYVARVTMGVHGPVQGAAKAARALIAAYKD